MKIQFFKFCAACVGDIFERAKEPEFLVFVIEYCMSTDEIAIECAHNLSINPIELNEIHSLLPGGDIYNWI